MKRSDLSAADQELLNTEFSPELEKEAAEQVKVAQELFTTGFTKIAAETADELDKLAAEEDKGDEGDDKGEEGKEPKKELNEEQKKEAAARGAFIAQGYIEGLKKLGSDRHGDEMAYLYPFVNEKLASMGKVLAFGKSMAGKATGAVASGGKAVAHHAGQVAAKGAAKGGTVGKAMEVAGKAVGKAGKTVANNPGKTMAAVGATGAGLAGLKMMNRKKD